MLELFKPPVLPKMLDGAVMCVDANAWNSLLAYVNSQTEVINRIIGFVNDLNEHENSDAEFIKNIAKILEEHIEE